ncbi:HAD-IA family hydrolase [Arsenicicoccus piscis]|uniref:HAD family hydrolase n=1 Tax=Arsenicicoccus piscis TaxID=673954 RepID=A0ABQ6HMV3_9MICO|nr:HAD-IA family hydrolase [Arsenicicoccus piscis]MCH8629028.1 HAD-IA family hydrolase [Arsenicicoccus piscis]GMA19647.1 hypothetical protein GCM10025862_16680 [Arsenicicoccus piscis]
MTDSDRIVESIEIERAPEAVWELVSQPGWFVNDDALREHTVRWHDDRSVTVTDPVHGSFTFLLVRSDEPRVIEWRGWSGGDLGAEPSSTVTFSIDPVPGGSRLQVVESGLDALALSADALRAHVEENTRAWQLELRLAKEHVETANPAGPRPCVWRPAAVLWDMDGTITDSEPLWSLARVSLAAEHGVDWVEPEPSAFAGKPMPHTAETLRDRGVELPLDEIPDRLVAMVSSVLDDDDPDWRPGARELLAEVIEAGIPVALVTQAFTGVAMRVARRAHGQGFSVVVAGDDVTHAKPHPQPYLLACQRLGVDPSQCLAIEDSETGTSSAVAAGITTIVVPHGAPIAPGPGRVIIDTLAGVHLADLPRLVGRD